MVVQISALAMFNLWKQLAVCDAVAAQLIGHDHSRHVLQALEQSFDESFRGIGIPPRLNEDIEDDAVLIHGTPKIVLYSLDANEHLVQVPFVPWSWPATAPASGKGLAKFFAPAPDRFVGDDD